MPQASKVLRSRNTLRRKIIKCHYEIREFRKTRKRHLNTITKLKLENRKMRQVIEGDKQQLLELTKEVESKNTITQLVEIQKPAEKVVTLEDADQTRALCVLLVIHAVVSYRSVPRILELFKSKTEFAVPWVPHFTSVINWSLRLGLGLLKQVKPITKPWIAIMDHSIDIGTKKALVVLRVTMDALSERGSAIRLEDCECIGLTVSDTVTGETISSELETIFAQAGHPQAIVKDADATLQKGVRLYSKGQEKRIPTIDDIGHTMANALKCQFEKQASYKRFTALMAHGAKCLRQTDLAFIIPPKLRTKGRFQSISKLGKWAEKMLNVFASRGPAEKGSRLDRLRIAFPHFSQSREFILRFALATSTVSEVMEILKNKGLDKVTYKQSYELSKKLPRNSKVKKRLQAWLKQNIKTQKQLTSFPLLVSSDIIESLFGNFKHIIERSPQADMNRTVLLIPALCGKLDDTVIRHALHQASHDDLEVWDKKHIPYTVRRKRSEFFKDDDSQKVGKSILG